ncbi:hypothetical protein ACET3Z_022599 [Daucus carota]
MAEPERQANFNEKNVVVVMVPFPAQGHLNQLLHLSRLVSAYNIPVYYVATTTHCLQARIRVQGWTGVATSDTTHMIHFHQVPTPAFISPPPNPHAAMKFPSHLQPSFDAAMLLREPVAALVALLATTARRVIVIHDSFIPSVVQDVVSRPNVEAYSFQPVSAFLVACYYAEIVGKPLGIEDEIARKLPRRGATMTSEMMELISRQKKYHKYSSGVLLKYKIHKGASSNTLRF